ncbi:MAG: hypothetical protein ACP5U2_11025 [Bryobacteraceae bacterium]
MRMLWREFRELVRGPEFLAILIICLLLGTGWPQWACPAWDHTSIQDRVSRILTACPLEELFDALQGAARWLH